MKTILITGGTGFIGSHTCLSLLESKFKVVVVDSNVNSSKTCLKCIDKILNLKKLSNKNGLT